MVEFHAAAILRGATALGQGLLSPLNFVGVSKLQALCLTESACVVIMGQGCYPFDMCAGTVFEAEEKYRIVSVRYCKILLCVLNLEVRKFARCYCLVTTLTYVRKTSLHLSHECVWLIGAVGYHL